MAREESHVGLIQKRPSVDEKFTPARLWVVIVVTGDSTIAVKLSSDVEDFAWAPDGKRLAVFTHSGPSNDGTASTSLLIAERQGPS